MTKNTPEIRIIFLLISIRTLTQPILTYMTGTWMTTEAINVLRISER